MTTINMAVAMKRITSILKDVVAFAQIAVWVTLGVGLLCAVFLLINEFVVPLPSLVLQSATVAFALVLGCLIVFVGIGAAACIFIGAIELLARRPKA